MESLQQVCQNCILRVQRKFLAKNQKNESIIFFGVSSKSCRTLSKNFSAILSRVDSTCPGERFEQKLSDLANHRRKKSTTNWENLKQDGRLAPAYFSPNYKYFDQLLQTVKNKTTVLILVFKECLQTSIRPLISVLYAKGYHNFPLKKFSHSAEKFRRGTLLCFTKFLIPKNVKDKRGGGYHDFLSKLFCLTVPKNFVGEPLRASQNF